MKAWLILMAALLLGLRAAHHAGEPSHPLLIKAQSVPDAPASAIPWRLNTRCTINSRNLPTVDPERIA